MSYSDDEILSALQDCYEEHGKVTIRLFRDFRGPSAGTVINRFGTFNDALEEAEIPLTESWNSYSNEEILEQVRTVAKNNGSVRPKYFGGDIADRGQIDRTFGSIGKAAGIADCHEYLPDYVECSDCGGLFNHIGSHITSSSCDFQNISDYEKEIYKGILLGDGCISGRDRVPYFSVSMSGESGKEFTLWLSNELEVSTVRFEKKLDKDNHNTVYTLRTQSHDYFNQLSDWYSSGEKVYPNDLELTPTILKMWYISDGSLSDSGPIITCWNESERSNFLMSLFSEIDLDVTWQSGNSNIYIRKSSQQDFFEYMGSPVPGFEYKW